ncbi:tyrosine-type recombinase/integrase [Tsuneonella sp. HG222]
MKRLSALAVKAAERPGRYGDGDGLYLVVGQGGAKSWIVRIQKDGRRRDVGLGSAAKVPLKLARERAALVRSQVEAGIDPVLERRKRGGIPTFREAAVQVHTEHKKGWKNGKHQAQWLATLQAYAFPALGDVSVSEVEAPAVRDALIAIWLEKPETARRLRQRINTIIDWAVAKGFRDTGLALPVIDKSLPKQRDRVKHHAAVPYAQLPDLMIQLREREGVGRLALEAVILTAARSGEVRKCTWDEVDLDRQIWTIPAERMKGGREHIVPLSKSALAVFERMKPYARGEGSFVFPGAGRGKPLSDMTLTKVLRNMGRTETVHGFRSSFRDWVAEQTSYPRELAEVALAHVNSDKTEAAYLRSDRRKQRTQLMDEWSNYCG